MEYLFSFIFLSLAIFLTITLINSITGPFLRSAPFLQQEVPVSVLIPARNEEKNIQRCIEALQQQDYSQLEILVLNDQSNDHTADLVKQITQNDERIRLIEGAPLPSGWIGKNWACHQLSQLAVGEIIIFTDADNYHTSDAVRLTVGWMQHHNLSMFSAFPQQLTMTFFEKLIVPVIDLILYASLVLWLTYYTRFPSLAAANGQWLAFRREDYQKIGGHQAVKHQIVEDVEFSRMAKRKGLKILTTAGTSVIFARMYSSLKEIWHGFSKNLFGLVSKNTLAFSTILLGFLFVHTLPFLMIYISQFHFLSLMAVLLILLLRFILAFRYKHPIIISILLHPVSILLIILIGLNSLYQAKFGQIDWKGRKITLHG
jgi:chlorobactene glucosyltransferase